LRKQFNPVGRVLFVLAAALLGTLVAHAANPAHRDLELGRADSALQSLNTTLAAHPSDAEALNLRCRVYYQEQDWDKAIADCETAAKLAPGDSNFHLWLGRAYGRKAEHASLMATYPLARKVHTEFEQAVQLDPRNAVALSDLGEFDVMAPIMLGGGIARAAAIAQQLNSVSPAAALTLQARIAESKKDYAIAESDLKQAIRQSPDPPMPGRIWPRSTASAAASTRWSPPPTTALLRIPITDRFCSTAPPTSSSPTVNPKPPSSGSAST
jgi:tetratricopeptide (TPR) repeat protein